MTIARSCRASSLVVPYPPSRASSQTTSPRRLLAVTTALPISRRICSTVPSTTHPAMTFHRCRRVSSHKISTICRLNGMVKTEGRPWLAQRPCLRPARPNAASLANFTRNCKASLETTLIRMRRRPRINQICRRKEVETHPMLLKSLRPLVLVVLRRRVHVLRIQAAK